MMGRQRDKKRRTPLGTPRDITLFSTPEGWRHSVRTMEGGTLCGRLVDVPVNASPAEAQAAAAAVVAGLAHDFHGAHIDVTWDPPGEPGSWTAQVLMVAPLPNTRDWATSPAQA